MIKKHWSVFNLMLPPQGASGPLAGYTDALQPVTKMSSMSPSSVEIWQVTIQPQMELRVFEETLVGAHSHGHLRTLCSGYLLVSVQEVKFGKGLTT